MCQIWRVIEKTHTHTDSQKTLPSVPYQVGFCLLDNLIHLHSSYIYTYIILNKQTLIIVEYLDT